MARALVTLAPETSLREAAALLSEKQISGAPVCTHDGRVLGVLSTADVTDHCNDSETARTVGQAMTPEVIAIHAEDPVQRAIEKMAFEGVHRLVVLDARERPIGIVTSMDVLRELAGYARRDERVVAVAPPDDVG